MTGERVLVTRPEPGASATAVELAEAGFSPLVLPLARIVARAVEPLPEPADFDAAALTSANAIRHAPPALLETLAGKRCYAVGDATAAVAREAGLAVQAVAGGDAEHLAAAIAGSEPAGARMLYPCGRVRRAGLARALADAGFAVTEVETYDSLPVAYTADAVADRIGWNPVRGALVYSAAGAERLVHLVERPQFAMLFVRTVFFCLSGRIAGALGKERAGRTVVAREPSERAMIEAAAGSRPLFTK